jgi:predicted negative regulator of RcsB-dependent stress response
MRFARDALLRPQRHDRAVALVGPGGIGKSVVAAELAHQLAPCFAGGQLWIDASAFEPRRIGQEEIAEALLRAEATANPMLPREGRISLARSFLCHSRRLIIVDGIEDAGQVMDLVPHHDWPAAMILTSRSRLRLDVEQLVLEPLSGAEGIELLRQVAGEAAVLRDTHLCVDLLRATGGLPLAIRVVGGLVAQDPGSVQELLHQLRNETTRSSFAKSEAIPVAARGVLTVAYERLSPPAADLLRLLGVLTDERITLTLLQVVPEVRHTLLRPALDELLAGGFVEPDGEGYRMHPIVRRFAREQLSAEELDSAPARLASKHLDAPDLNGVLRDFHSPQAEAERAPSDRIQVQEYAMRLAAEAGDKRAEARALANLGALHRDAGQILDAASALRASLALTQATGDAATAAPVALALGHTEHDLGAFEAARESYELSARLFAQIEDADGRVVALTSLGDILASQGDMAGAGRMFKTALAEVPLKNDAARAQLEARLASVADLAGETSHARELYDRALERAAAVGNHVLRAELMLRRAFVEARTSNPQDARHLLELALHAHLELGSLQGAARAALALGSIALEREELLTAREQFEQAASLVESTDQQLAALAAYGCGLVAHATGHNDEAVALLEFALAHFREASDRLGEAYVLIALVAPLHSTGHETEARAVQATAEASFEQIGTRPGNAGRALRALMLAKREPEPDR